MRPTVPSVCFRTVEIDVKHQLKILTSFFGGGGGGGHGLFGLIPAALLALGITLFHVLLEISNYYIVSAGWMMSLVEHTSPNLERWVRFPAGSCWRLEKQNLWPVQPRARRWWGAQENWLATSASARCKQTWMPQTTAYFKVYGRYVTFSCLLLTGRLSTCSVWLSTDVKHVSKWLVWCVYLNCCLSLSNQLLHLQNHLTGACAF